jgi:uncharacterized protein YyaL (SSP411 family)
MADTIDEIDGGFGGAPKFPNAVLLQLFLNIGSVHKQRLFVDHVLFTLEKMSRGGIYDQLGGGFHRYATDQYWLIPHFEKMLYDNALLLKLYVTGFQISKNDEFKRVVFETGDYIRREMTSPHGGFFSSQDADSEGIEGKYFYWDIQEIKQHLEPQEAQLFIEYFNVTETGNFEGHNIFNRVQITGVTKEFSSEFFTKIQQAKRKLFEVREKRVKPFRDEKIITSWNGLMISALSSAHQVFGRDDDYQTARKAALFVLDAIKMPNGNLGRVYKDNQIKIEAMLDDYSFLTKGLIDLFETDFNPRWLKESLKLTTKACEIFGSDDGMYTMASDVNKLVIQPLSGTDNAMPSGISVHCENLLRLAAFTGNRDFHHEAERILSEYNHRMEQDHWGTAGLIECLYPFDDGYNEFVFVNDGPAIPEVLIRTRQHYIPYRIIAYRNTLQNMPDFHTAMTLFNNRNTIQGKPTCYVCSKKSCSAPVTTWDELKAIIDNL